jgi:hypothetical protein
MRIPITNLSNQSTATKNQKIMTKTARPTADESAAEVGKEADHNMQNDE